MLGGGAARAILPPDTEPPSSMSADPLRPQPLIDPAALMSIRSLELRARTVVEGLRSGLHRSPYHGFSAEFTEYRQYSPGDDLRYLDWKVLARSDRLFLKKFEDETNLRCHFVVDRSRSMDYGSGSVLKGDYAATLAATLAMFLHLQGDAVGLLSFDEQVREFLPARQRPGHLRLLMLALEAVPAGRGTDVIGPLERAAELLRKRGLVIVLSDFLAPVERLDRALLELTAAGHEVELFEVSDPAEENFGFAQAALFEDAENGRSLHIDPAEVRADYLQRRSVHREALKVAAGRHGCGFHETRTDRPLELALLQFLEGRLNGRRIRRRAAQGGAA